jgi:hypothetical protein
MHNLTILDIETIAMPEADIRAKLPPFRPEKVAIGNLKDPDKIAAKIEEARATYGDSDVKNGALNATTGTLAIIGFMHMSGRVHQYTALDEGRTEADVIADAFKHILATLDMGGIISGYFVKGFDLPFIIQRAWLLGVKVPARVFNGFKPRYPFSESVVCLQEVCATCSPSWGFRPRAGAGRNLARFGPLTRMRDWPTTHKT